MHHFNRQVTGGSGQVGILSANVLPAEDFDFSFRFGAKVQVRDMLPPAVPIMVWSQLLFYGSPHLSIISTLLREPLSSTGPRERMVQLLTFF